MTIWPHRLLGADESAPPGEVWPRADGARIWVPPGDRTAPEAFLNHSCDPNVWMADEVTLVARRAIAPLSSVTGRDYELAELQARYGKHFHPMVLRRLGV